MKCKSGGPAFPVIIGHNAFQQPVYANGVTIRDYLAAHAPFTQSDAISFAKAAGKSLDGPELVAVIAHMRYQYADAMLKEREK